MWDLFWICLHPYCLWSDNLRLTLISGLNKQEMENDTCKYIATSSASPVEERVCVKIWLEDWCKDRRGTWAFQRNLLRQKETNFINSLDKNIYCIAFPNNNCATLSFEIWNSITNHYRCTLEKVHNAYTHMIPQWLVIMNLDRLIVWHFHEGEGGNVTFAFGCCSFVFKALTDHDFAR